MDDSRASPTHKMPTDGDVSDLISSNTKEKAKNRQFINQELDQDPPSLFADQKKYSKEPDLSAIPELPNAGLKEFIASELQQISNHDEDDKSKRAAKYETISLLDYFVAQPKENSEQHLAPEKAKISLNDERNSRMQPLTDVTSSSPTDPLQYAESKEDETGEFMMDMRDPVGSSSSPAPSFDHGALENREEFSKPTGGMLIGTGFGIKLGYNHDESMKKLQHNMLASAQVSNVKLQKERVEFQKESSVGERQLAAENQRKWTEWQEEKQQHHDEEIQKIKEEHASELNAQDETLQNAMKMEIDREKVQLIQESRSRISQEVTKACNKQELCIKHFSRTIRNLHEEKQGQEMDMEAYRQTIASQDEDLLRAKRKVSELMHNLDERSREIGGLHAKIGNLDKTAKEAIFQAERMNKELKNARWELEASKKEVEFALDSASDAETAPGPTIFTWGSGNRTLEAGNQELQLKIMTKKLAEQKLLGERQNCQSNLLRGEIMRLRKAHEEDNVIIKQQGRRIRSLEGLQQRLLDLTESFENLKDEMYQLSRVEEQDKAIIKQQQTEIEELVATRPMLKEVRKFLKVKPIDLDKCMIKPQQYNAITRQQQCEVQELEFTRAKLKEVQRSLNTKQTNLEKTMVKPEVVNNELQNLRKLQGRGDATPQELPESNQERPALTDHPIHSEPKADASFLYLDKQNQLPNDGETAHALEFPKNNKNDASAFQGIEILGRKATSAEGDDCGDYDYGDDDDESLHRILQMAVEGGAAILSKLEIAIAAGWLGGWEDPENSRGEISF